MEINTAQEDLSVKSDTYWIEHEKEYLKALSKAQPISKGLKYLLPHERELLDSNQLRNITHKGATSVWLEAPSSIPKIGQTNVYRPMGDIEVEYLLEHRILPDTQPYQTIVEGAVGRWYANKYLTGKKWTDTSPSTIVEFTCPIELIETLKKMQMKVEDGALSMGLGHKAGKGLGMFNDALKYGQSSFRIVKVKRTLPSNKK